MSILILWKCLTLDDDQVEILKINNSTNPKDLIGITKHPIQYVPPIQAILTSEAFKDGAIKYGPFNWREKKVKYSIYYAAAMRHLMSAYDGEEYDPVSKVLHIAHVSACIAILMDAMYTGNLIDDRPVSGPSGRVITDYSNANNKG